MDRVLSFTTHEEERRAGLAYWLGRTPEERIAEVERLRREYIASLSPRQPHASAEGLQRVLLVTEHETR